MGSGGEILKFGGLTVAIRAAAEVTGGAFSVIEELPPLFDTPAHVHANEDEYFHIIEGEHIVLVGEEEHRLRRWPATPRVLTRRLRGILPAPRWC